MKKILKHLIAFIFIMSFLFLPSLILADSSASDNLRIVGQTGNAPYQATDKYTLSKIIRVVIQAFLGLLGILFLVYLIYAGFNWMTARGDEEKVTKAKETIQQAIIGLIIIIAAYSITYFIFSNLPGAGGGGVGEDL